MTEALKWVGYSVIALLVLSIGAGLGMLLVVVVTVGAALFSVFSLIWFVTNMIRSICEDRI